LDNKFRFRINEDLQDLRLDRALSQCPQIKSRTQVQKLIQMGRVLLDGQSVKASYRTKTNDEFTIELISETGTQLKAFAMKLDILFEDQCLIVVNKPAGLVVHPAAGHTEDTLVNALLAHSKHLSKGSAHDRPGIIHRLDRDTSGLLVVAKTDECHEHLANQFKERKVLRRYWAIVYGKPGSVGRIENPIARHPIHRKKMSVQSGGKLSITNFTCLAIYNNLSLLEVILETGRTHQIRVHLADRGYPVVGDRLYGGEKRHNSINNQQLRRCVHKMKRFALHAYSLGFHHPVTGEDVKFAVSWPNDLKEFVNLCGFDNE